MSLKARATSVASFAPKCATCRTAAGCARHGMFTCPTCKRTVRWRDGGDPEMDCTDCWYDERARPPVAQARPEIGATP